MHDRDAFTRATETAVAQERFFQIDLHPEDALFLPAGWWHEVESAGNTIAVNYWCGLGAVDVRHMAPFHLRHTLHVCLHAECERALACMRATSRAYIQQHACSHRGRRSPVATAAELLHRHLSALMDDQARAAASSTGPRGLPSDAVAIAALQQKDILWLLNQWLQLAPETLGHWLLQCMSPGAGEALTNALEQDPEAGMHACQNMSYDVWPVGSSSLDTCGDGNGAGECMHDRLVCGEDWVAKTCSAHRDWSEAGRVATPWQVESAGVSRERVSSAAEDDSKVASNTADCEREPSIGASLELGEFAQRIAAVERQQGGQGNVGSCGGQVHAESPGMQVLQRVFALVDTAVLTQVLERRRSQWRYDCLMRVLKSHL